jgi:Transposase domain (DUF772)
LLLYGYCIGVNSSRKIEKATYDNIAFRYLAADRHPDHDTLASFSAAAPGRTGWIVRASAEIMLKSRAGEAGQCSHRWHQNHGHASNRRSVSYQKISDREQCWQNEVQRLLKQAQQTDQQEDQRFG